MRGKKSHPCEGMEYLCVMRLQTLIRKLFPGFGIDWEGEIIKWKAICDRIRLCVPDGDNERCDRQGNRDQANPK